MLGYKDISIHFLTGTPWLDWLALIVLVGLAVFLYRRTNPPVPRYLKIILFGLRTVAVLALIGALLEPVISYSREFERNKRVSVVLDASSSMDRIENGKTRRVRQDSLLSSQAYDELRSSADVESYFFGADIAPSRDQVNIDQTAMGDALYDLHQAEMADPADYWLLVSDGNSNAGRDVDDAIGAGSAPVISVNIATDIGNFDIGLEDVQYNTVVFVGQPTEIQVQLNWHNAAGKVARVELLDRDRVVAGGTLSIDQEAGFGEVSLKYVPSEPGQKLLQVRIPGLDNEETISNNSRTIALKVLKSRINVLLVTDRPDYEVGFLSRYLRQSDKYDMELKVLGGKAGNLAGSFPDRQTELNRYDLVILHDPDPQLLSGRDGIIKSYLSEKGGAIWVMMGLQFASRGPVEWFDRLLPFYQSHRQPIQYGEFRGEPSESELFHPAVRLADDRTSIRETWESLPPFRSLVYCDVIDSQGVVLAYGEAGNRLGQKPPILGYKRFGPGKLIASAAGPFWYWGFANLGFGEDDSHYGDFLEGVISWLTVREDFDPVRISPTKEVFNRGESVQFDAVAFDQGFRPIPGVTGSVSLQGEQASDQFEADLIDKGEGKFTAEFSKIPPGKYTWRGKLEKDGRTLKQSDGVIQIEMFSLEEYDQSGDPATLMTVSRKSGGGYFTFNQFDDAIRAINTEPIAESIAGEFSLWGRFWLLAIFILALASEWVIRKANNLL